MTMIETLNPLLSFLTQENPVFQSKGKYFWKCQTTALSHGLETITRSI